MGNPGGSVFAIAILAAMSLACASSAVAPESKPTSSELVPLDAITVTPRPEERTPTPDLSSALPSEEALEALMEVPGVSDVLRAVASGDVDALLGLISWQPQPCGSPHGGTNLCPDGTITGTELPMVNVGWPDRFWVTADTLRPTLSQLLTGEPPALRFASRTSQADDGLGDTYYVGLQGDPKGRGISPIGSADNVRTGIFFTIRTGAEGSIAELAMISETWSAVDHANATGLTRHEVLTFSP